MPFALDDRLKVDTFFVCALPVCDVLLMNEARYPWAILVPRVADAVELHALQHPVRQAVFSEMMQVSSVIAAFRGVEKLNTGALGNLVAQLHIHIVGRARNDPAWPGPVWGHSPRLAYRDDGETDLLQHLRTHLSPDS